jgi:hypothetical protein
MPGKMKRYNRWALCHSEILGWRKRWEGYKGWEGYDPQLGKMLRSFEIGDFLEPIIIWGVVVLGSILIGLGVVNVLGMIFK